MPIAYSCPRCGKHYSVAEQYAGQTGPCATCGQKITVPPLTTGYADKNAASPGGGAGIAAVAVILVVALVLCSGGLLALLLPTVQGARTAARRSQASNNLKQIGLALHNYHDAYGTFPPAVVTSGNGEPLYSGRVLLLPFLGQEALYRAWDKTKPWDSGANLPLSQSEIPQFRDPADNTFTPGETNYLFVTGSSALFNGNKAVALVQIPDGTANTLAVIEVKSSGTKWAEPKDLNFSQPIALPPGNHPGGNLALFADGSVRTLSPNTTPLQVHAAVTIAGGEAVFLP